MKLNLFARMRYIYRRIRDLDCPMEGHMVLEKYIRPYYEENPEEELE